MHNIKLNWTILPTPGNVHDELELDTTMTLVESFFFSTLVFSSVIFSDTTRDSTDGDYGIEDVRSDQDSDNDDEDESRIPWLGERFVS